MKNILLLLFVFAITCYASACTTFFINKNGQMVFGRNYDWITGNGMVCSNQRGLFKKSAATKEGKAISWISLYGSITFNQYGKEFPTGGMNEKGLVVELMWLNETKYPVADNRAAMGTLQWIQYQLDNCSTVDELIATDSDIRIASAGTEPLHYLVADATGKAATIEFLNGKMVVHTGKELPFPVLTNSVYASSLQQSGVTSNNKSSNSFQDNSIERFAKACKLVKEYQVGGNQPVVDYSFNILNEVAQGSHTKWSIVYDITNKKIHFRTNGFPEIKNVSFSALDLSCKAASKSLELNQHVTGDIASLFKNYNIEMNKKIVEKSFDESSSEIRANKEEIRDTWEYATTITCKKE
ncbi:MAG: linear amide C-N hydrolase [Chitinophagaceae bacterium]